MDITDSAIGYVETMDYTDAADATENDEIINYYKVFFIGTRRVYFTYVIA